MGCVIALIILVLLALLPIGICASYNVNNLSVKLTIGPFSASVFPMRKKTAEKDRKSKKEDSTQTQKTRSSHNGGSLEQFMPLIRTALDFLGELRRKIRVKNLSFHLILGGNDPYNLGCQYGRAWGIVGGLIALLEQSFTIKKREISVDCNFMGVKTEVIAQMDIHISLGRLISLFVRYGFRMIREYLKVKNYNKGGAQV